MSWSPMKAYSHRSLLMEGSKEVLPFSTYNSSREVTARSLVGAPGQSETTRGNQDIVQFSTAIFYCEEDEGHAEITVMRFGEMQEAVSVKYRTEDASAKSNERYKATSGELVFAPGEYSKVFKVEIMDPGWMPTVEFKVYLSDARGCVLGLYLYEARVKVIDNDAFPSNSFKPHVETMTESQSSSDEGEGVEMSKSLYKDYLSLILGFTDVRWRMLVILICDQLHNMYLWYTMWIIAFMVDDFFSEDVVLPLGQHNTAILIGVSYVVLIFVLHLWDYIKLKLDLSGVCCLYLQRWVFRKYLNFSDESRIVVQPADLHVCMLQEAPQVSRGVSLVTSFAKSFGKTVVLLYFMLAEHDGIWWCMIVIPLALLGFLNLLYERLQGTANRVASEDTALIALTKETCEKYRLIANYFQRPHMNALFEHQADRVKEANVNLLVLRQHMEYFPNWMGNIFVCVYIIVAHSRVAQEVISPGAFVSTIIALKEMSSDFRELYSQAMILTSVTSALATITHLMNMETDLNDHLKMFRSRLQYTNDQRNLLLHAPQRSSSQEKTDEISIRLVNMGFKFKGSPSFLIRNVHVDVPQGRLVAIIGPHSSGRATLLRLLGNEAFPTEGCIQVPLHLRIIHVSQESILLRDTLWTNLVFGSKLSSDCEEDVRRVYAILRENLQARKVEQLLQEELRPKDGTEDSHSEYFVDDEQLKAKSADMWQKNLTHSDKARIHLARALNLNAEMLVLQRPFSNFTDAEGGVLLAAIKEHVHNRGLELPKEKKHLRRPRSCFFSAEGKDHAQEADIILQLVPPTDADGNGKPFKPGTCYVIPNKQEINDNFHPVNPPKGL